jgi:hypothetical protein
MKQTAVEWLIEQLKVNNYISDNAHWLIQEAKEMEKEQIVEARITAPILDKPSNEEYLEEAKTYYKETFKL